MAIELTTTASRTARVFLSYKRNAEPDGAVAREVVAALSGAGHHIFIDQRLTVGQAWAEEIEKQVRQSDYLIVFLTAESSRSEMVRGEIEIARHHAAINGAPRILPVRLAFEGPLPYPLNAYLDKIQYAMWSSPADTQGLLDELQAVLGGHTPHEAGPIGAPAGADAHLPPPYAAPLPVPGGTLDVDDPWYLARATDAFERDRDRPIIPLGNDDLARGGRGERANREDRIRPSSPPCSDVPACLGCYMEVLAERTGRLREVATCGLRQFLQCAQPTQRLCVCSRLLRQPHSDLAQGASDLPRNDKRPGEPVKRFAERTDEETGVTAPHVVVAGPAEPADNERRLAGKSERRLVADRREFRGDRVALREAVPGEIENIDPGVVCGGSAAAFCARHERPER